MSGACNDGGLRKLNTHAAGDAPLEYGAAASSSSPVPLGLGGDKGSIQTAGSSAPSPTSLQGKLKRKKGGEEAISSSNEDESSTASSPCGSGYTSPGPTVISKNQAAAEDLLLQTTAKEKETFKSIYTKLTTKPLQELLDATTLIEAGAVFAKNAFEWPTLFKSLKEEGDLMRKEVPPLAFLRLVHSDSEIKELLEKISSEEYCKKWKGKIGTLTKWIGDKMTPWEHTYRDLGEDIKKKQTGNDLMLDGFLEALPEDKKNDAKGYIDNNQWEELVKLMMQ